MPKTGTLLVHYMEQLASGDLSCLEPFCSKFANRLVYVPVLAQRQHSKNIERLNVLTLEEENKSFIPAFTNESEFHKWRSAYGLEDDYEPVPLLGADVCQALPPHTRLVLDLASKHALRISPDLIKVIISIAKAEEESWEDEQTISKPPPSKPFGHTQEVKIVQLAETLCRPPYAETKIEQPADNSPIARSTSLLQSQSPESTASDKPQANTEALCSDKCPKEPQIRELEHPATAPEPKLFPDAELSGYRKKKKTGSFKPFFAK